LNYLGDNKFLEDDEIYCNTVELSKVDDKVIKILLNQLRLDISDEFFISFESILKIGDKAKKQIKLYINELDEAHNFKKELFKFMLNYIIKKDCENPLVLELYHPDFTIRANALKKLEKENNIFEYFKFLLPLIDDPDDSVRWAVINLFIKHNQIKNSQFRKKLKNRIKKESNIVIKNRILKILNYT